MATDRAQDACFIICGRAALVRELPPPTLLLFVDKASIAALLQSEEH